MGIKGLAKLLSDEAPDSIREVEFKSLHGRRIAIDASMAIYQFLIAVRSGGPNQQAMMLTNADGETTSHIQGMFNRTIRFLTEGLKPVFVFDGKVCVCVRACVCLCVCLCLCLCLFLCVGYDVHLFSIHVVADAVCQCGMLPLQLQQYGSF
mmetsp:Transcript_22274/g.62063  ORF Transcript_22274/g.62063 Transcript_22274/m.62063 type:complete len:151 (+) Transcript_22274:325-777(+)